MLGYRCSPRIADLSDQRFWRATAASDPRGDYGPLIAIARNRVHVAKIAAHWPDMLRVAGSLVTETVRAYDLLRMLGRDGHPSALRQAFAECGRIAKTLHLLALVDPVDTGYRRAIGRQLTVQESRHRLARKIFHGQRGELRQAYRRARRTSSARSGWSSTPSCCGTPATPTPPSPRCAPRATQARRRRHAALTAGRRAHQHARPVRLHRARRRGPAAVARPAAARRVKRR